MAHPVDFIVPNPLISRGKPVLRSASAEEPVWIAVQVGVGPSHVLVVWSAPGADSTDWEHAPAAYRIESSADSTNGADGTWRLEVSVTDNAVRTRSHRFEFDGQSWVRLVVMAAANPDSGASIAELDVHDASDGTDDTWIFLGDSAGPLVQRDAVGHPSSYAEHIHAEYPGYFPALIDGRVAGERTHEGLGRLDGVLALNPDFRHFAIAYGSSEAQSGELDVERFRANLRTIIDRLLAAGRVPVLARIPTSVAGKGAAGDCNRVVAELERERGLPPGADLHAWFEVHPEQLTERGHPTAAGWVAVHRLWAEAMDMFYAPH